jgi:hypothetical protein
MRCTDLDDEKYAKQVNKYISYYGQFAELKKGTKRLTRDRRVNKTN